MPKPLDHKGTWTTPLLTRGWFVTLVPRHLLLQLWLNYYNPMTPSAVLHITLFQVMTEHLMGTKPLLECNYINFIPNDCKTPNIASNCYFNMWEDFLIKWYQGLFLTDSFANITENIIFVRFICLHLWNLGCVLCNLVRLTLKMRVMPSTLVWVIPRFGHSSWNTDSIPVVASLIAYIKKYRHIYDLSQSL